MIRLLVALAAAPLLAAGPVKGPELPPAAAVASPPHRVLIQYGLDRGPDGSLVYAGTPEPVPTALGRRMLAAIGKIMVPADLDRREAGRFLLRSGLPIAFNGVHLINPSGETTFYGSKLYQALKDRPEAVDALSGERLKEALDTMHAAAQGFEKAPYYPEVAAAKLDAAWSLLQAGTLRAGEERLVRADYSGLNHDLGAYLEARQSRLEAAYRAAKPGTSASKRLAIASTALRALRAQTHATFKSSRVAATHGGLPVLLSVLEKLDGPLDEGCLRAVIESLPMGELIYKSRAFELWRAGVTGRGVKVAVLDMGAASHPDIEPAVERRVDLTGAPGPAAAGHLHGLSVASVIHALAPEAKLLSYKIGAHRGDLPVGPSLDEAREMLIRALESAVDAGASIVNLSWSLSMKAGRFWYYLLKSDAVIAKMSELHARTGVVYAVSASNAGERGVPVNWLSWPDGAVPFGAIDAAGRHADFSDKLPGYDRTAGRFVRKPVLLTPGVHVPVATIVKDADHVLARSGPDGKSAEPERRPGAYVPAYRRASGTSFSAPYGAGMLALLLHAARKAAGESVQSVPGRGLGLAAAEALIRTGRPVFVAGAAGQDFYAPSLVLAAIALARSLRP